MKLKRILLILALTLSLVAPLVPRPISTVPGLRAPQGSSPAKTTTAKPASDIVSKILANGLEIIVLEDI